MYTSTGDLYVVDIPYGRILKISPTKEVSVAAEWDGEPNGLAVDPEGKIAVADYKQVQFPASWYLVRTTKMACRVFRHLTRRLERYTIV